MFDVPVIVQYIALLTIIVGVFAYIFKVYRDSTGQYDQDTIKRLKDSNDILRAENVDLKAQIAAMELRLKSLEQANVVYQNTVTGKDMMMEIQKSISQFTPYISAFEDFRKHDVLIIEKLDQLLGK